MGSIWGASGATLGVDFGRFRVGMEGSPAPDEIPSSAQSLKAPAARQPPASSQKENATKFAKGDAGGAPGAWYDTLEVTTPKHTAGFSMPWARVEANFTNNPHEVGQGGEQAQSKSPEKLAGLGQVWANVGRKGPKLVNVGPN